MNAKNELGAADSEGLLVEDYSDYKEKWSLTCEVYGVRIL